MDPFKTHGAISWPELMTTDPDAAVAFYETVFGWTTETMPMEAGPYHVVSGSEVSWSVPATDASTGDHTGVWRVLVVHNDNLAPGGVGSWVPLELSDADQDGTWEGSASFAATPRLTYVIQAVDRSGNVTWLDYVPSPTSRSPEFKPCPAQGGVICAASPARTTLPLTNVSATRELWV